jgi:membrane-bound lytic murein transglycosylase B
MRLSAHRRRLALYAAVVPLLIGGPVAGNGLMADQWWQASVSNALQSVRGADEPNAEGPQEPQNLEELLKGAHPTDPSAEVKPPAEGGVDVSDTDLPSRVLAAYRAAAVTMEKEDPGCHLDWPLLAGIGKVESGHARGGAVDAEGLTTSPILGPELSGAGDVAAIRDTDNGRWDDDPTWDRAVGPMQFIPSSWAIHGADGNGDGVRDPNNVADAALASAGYLCTGDRNVSVEEDRRAAVYSYNHSWDYVDLVLQWASAYANGTTVLTGELPGVVGVRHGGSGGSSDISRPRTAPGGGGSTPGASPKPTPSPTTPGTRPGSRPSPTPTSGASTSPGSGSGSGSGSTSAGAGSGSSGSGSTDTGSGSGSDSGSGSGSSPAPTGTPPEDPPAASSPKPTETAGPGCPSPSASPSPSDNAGTASPTATPTESPSPSPSPSEADSSASPTASPSPSPTSTCDRGNNE